MRKQFMYAILFSMALIGSVLMVSCSESDEPNGFSDASRVYIELDSEQQEYLNNAVIFSVDLWHAINATPEYEKKNFVFSPLSMQINLSLLANGATGETLKALTDVLLPDCENPSIEKLNKLNNIMIEKLFQVDKKAKFNMANSIWIYNGPEISNDYISAVNRYYDSWLFRFDMGSSAAMSAMNKWVEDATEGDVKDFLQSPPQNPALFLSVLLFKHGWTKKFEKSDTKQENFYCESGEVIKVPMMSKVDEIARIVAHEKSMRAIVPFGNGAFSLHLIKPDEGNSVDESLEDITKGEYYNRTLKLKMPRFSLESDIDFLDILRSMGLEDALNSLNYSAIMSESFKIDYIRQKSRIEVDEDGAVYKATTATAGGFTSPGPPPAIVEFYLDHPFAFEIHEESTGAILAMGKICNL